MSAETPKPPPPRIQRLLGGTAAGFVRGICRTLKYEVDDRAGLRERAPHDPVVWMFWHNRLLQVPYMRARVLPRPGGAAMTSTSKDGAWVAELLQRFGIQAIRGSPSRRSLGAIKEILAVLKRGEDIGITPDGSRGPKYHLKAGVVTIGQISRCELMPFSPEYERYWELKTWDNFRIPKPFSKVRLVLGPCLRVPREIESEEAFEAERLRLEQALMAVTLKP
ncbi:MAG: lysophospholipid acyltransferase family protein [Verrucomicrobia bacterium]|nr:lysophospholipid acyltransferase family protein [Verrucomicrobiota bacterium]